MVVMGLNVGAQAVEPASYVVSRIIFLGVPMLMGADAGEEDPAQFKGVTVSHANNPDGYSFEITEYEYNLNPGAYVK
jgi:hypothetical protein